MKTNDSQWQENMPEGVDWSWTSEAQDEQSQHMKKKKSSKGDANLLDKGTWPNPPF